MTGIPAPDEVRFEYDATREHITLDIGGGRLRLTAGDLERLAQHLGYLRASMVPEVAHELPAGSCPSIDVPRLAVQVTPDGSRAAVGVRTPVFGWLAFLLDRTQTEGLGKHLTEIAATMAPRVN
jgi:hypothetical protein